ncbi:MAG: hypothetical protein IBX47_09055 [Desulfuromonadales bacterium]|nr:hypothetical protein [Desulfuromonadales bacterium]
MIEDAGFFVMYLFYGLVFFTIGAAITSKNLRLSEIKVARVLWILALFAFAHGLSEWLELFLRMNHEHLQGEFYPFLIRGKFILTGLSFAFLFWFGAELLFLNKSVKSVRLALISLPGLLIGSVIYFSHIHSNFSEYDIYLRIFIAFPATLMAGYGFIHNAATLEISSHRGAKNLKLSGYAILLYGVFAGLFPSGLVIGGLPIEIFRASSAFLLLHGIIRALQVFDAERKAKMEESFKRLAQSEKMVALGKLSAGIAHEINNPLANALISIELLEQDLQPFAPVVHVAQPRIKSIKRNLGRASKIAGELLFFSHNREAQFEEFSLNEIIHKTFQLIGSRQNLYEFTFNLGELPMMKGIPWKIEEVLLNVLMNAMDATPERGKIEIQTRVTEVSILCTIQDHGAGVSEKVLGYLFDPFFTTKEPGKGTGLGLSICFGIMELHHGEIRINSKAGEGTLVQLLFPLPEGFHT